MNTQTKEEGIGRVGSLPKEMTLEECCVYVKHKLKLGSVKVFGDMKQPVKRLAVSPGSGKSAIAPAVSKGADVLVTGDIGHHEGCLLYTSKISAFLAMFRKIIVLIPLIYILPVFLEDNVQAVFLAEPIADVIAVATTLILFRKNFKKVLVEMKQKSETQDI